MPAIVVGRHSARLGNDRVIARMTALGSPVDEAEPLAQPASALGLADETGARVTTTHDESS